jgi:hypothetical protein
MWETLPEEQKAEYKRMILAFASLTELFAQKAENEEDGADYGPIINSKFQETVFQKTFHASSEDIGNTSYDAAICLKLPENKENKYLIGIKTFGIGSGDQKIAQFKANHDEWADTINKIESNSKSVENNKEKIDRINGELYKKLAVDIANLRNMRILSSESNLKGFSVKPTDDNVQAVYHVLMPSEKGEDPCIFVGETSYDKIEVECIEVLGCTSPKKPTNFKFKDGKHVYKYTPADSQLYMDFQNKNIIVDSWKVVYLDNPYKVFSDIADKIEGKNTESKLVNTIVKTVKSQPKIEKSYSWLLTNKDDEVEKFSGFNNFFGVSSKLAKEDRPKRIIALKDKFYHQKNALISEIISDLEKYLLTSAPSKEKKEQKAEFRNNILAKLSKVKNQELKNDALKLLFRTHQEMYIPIPDSKNFHKSNPKFFVDIGKDLFDDFGTLAVEEEDRSFDLIFEPSGEKIRAHITQDYGKGLASKDCQAILGKWILQDIFQLKPYEPLTKKRLDEIGLNGLRLYKIKGDNSIHIQFIWIDTDNPPLDFISK